jgi:hypothetical protein
MKTTRYISVLLGVVLLSIVSCEKYEAEPDYDYVMTEVEGQLMVRGSRELINDKPYKVELRMNVIHWFEDEPTQKNELLETYTDENGYYKLYHLSRRSLVSGMNSPEHRYYLWLSDGMALDESFRGEGRIEMIPQELGFDNGFDYFSGYKGVVNQFLNKKAWIRLHIENVNPQPGDRIRLEFPIDRYTQIIEGPANFEVLLYGIGNDYNALNYWITKNGVPIGLQTDSIMLVEMDTTYYKFEY